MMVKKDDCGNLFFPLAFPGDFPFSVVGMSQQNVAPSLPPTKSVGMMASVSKSYPSADFEGFWEE